MPQGTNNSLGRQIPQVDTTTYGQGDLRDAPKKTRKKRSKRQGDGPSHENARSLITRRGLLFGALGAGAVAAGVVGAQAIAQRSESSTEEIVTLEVSEEDVWDLESCSEVDAADAFELIGDFDLPFGSLVWVDDDEVAACLFPTEQASPLATVAAMSLSTGNYFDVLEAAVGADEGFEIYDVRGNSSGFAWMEADIMEGRWRLYAAPLSEFTLGEPHLIEEGGSEQEVPTITVQGSYVFWQSMAPVTNENARSEPSFVKRAHLSTGDAQTVYESKGRMSAPITTFGDGIIFTPRHDDAPSYCDLVRINAESGKIEERITLPSGMMPNQVGYGPTGFSFCFESISDYGGGIAHLGTYTPSTDPRGGSYEGLEWFRFNRTPTAAPCWCTDSWFMVKSNQSVCGVNLANRIFCSLGLDSGCLDWGD
ncbi:MAG: Tat pathway signal protein [Eggerthellaceae bacterium]|nr:Tat pathway signal protein [Eggerthellaceae bacterium]